MGGLLGGALTAAGWVADAVRRGADWLVGQFREVIAGIRNLDCNRIVAAVSVLDPTMIVVNLIPPLRTCLTAFRQGFICTIPETIQTLGPIIAGIARAAWEHRAQCLVAGIASTLIAAPGAGALWCGLYHYLMPKLQRVGRCIDQLRQRPQFWSELWREIRGAASSPPSGGIFETILRFACRSAGQFTLDVALGMLTGGGTAPQTIARWLAGAIPVLGTSSVGRAIPRVLAQTQAVQRVLTATVRGRQVGTIGHLSGATLSAAARARGATSRIATIVRLVQQHAPMCNGE